MLCFKNVLLQKLETLQLFKVHVDRDFLAHSVLV